MLLSPIASAATLMEEGYKHLEKEEWTEARRTFESELLQHPKNLEARYNLALLLARAGHHDQERELYRKNLEYGWHLPSAINLASIYTAEGKLSKGRNLLEKAAKRYKNEAPPRYLLADLEESAGRHKSAKEWYNKALKSDPLNGFAHIRYARFLANRKQYQEALEHAERATQLEKKSAACLMIRGDIQVAARQYDNALESYQKSLAIKPDAETRQKLIDLLHKLGKHERANRMQKALDRWIEHQKRS